VIHDKLHACYYCQKLVTNIWRHYETVHKCEARLQKIVSLVGKSRAEDRADEINKLRLLSDYYHNIKVLSQKSGELIVVRRPMSHSDTTYSDFLPCRFCLVFFRSELWQHCDNCKFRTADAGQKYQKDAMLLLAPCLLLFANEY